MQKSTIGFWGSLIISTQYILATGSLLNLGLGFVFLLGTFFYLYQELKSN